MCMALPYLVTGIESESLAEVEKDGMRRTVNISLVPDIAVGDYLLVYLDMAKAKLSEAEAAEVLALYEQVGDLFLPALEPTPVSGRPGESIR